MINPHALITFLILVLLTLSAPSYSQDALPQSVWESLGKTVNYHKNPKFSYVDASPHGFSPSIASMEKSLLVAYSEFNPQGKSQVRVKRWNGKAWSKKFTILNKDPTLNAFDPAIAVLGKTPYVAWTENDDNGKPKLYVTRRSTDGWLHSKRPHNVNLEFRANSPSLVASGQSLYLAWVEGNEDTVQNLYLKQLSPKITGKASLPLNRDSTSDAYEPSMTFRGNTGYITWSEQNTLNHLQIYVRKLGNGKNALLGKSLNMNINAHAVNPSVAIYKSIPYVAWVEFGPAGVTQVFVKRWRKGTWTRVGNVHNIEPRRHALSPTLLSGEDSLYLAWTELSADMTPRINIKQLKDKKWTFIEPINPVDFQHIASTPALVMDKGSLLATWKQDNPNGVFEIHVARLKGLP